MSEEDDTLCDRVKVLLVTFSVSVLCSIILADKEAACFTYVGLVTAIARNLVNGFCGLIVMDPGYLWGGLILN